MRKALLGLVVNWWSRSSHAVVAVRVDDLDEEGGGASTVLDMSFLMRSRPTSRRRCIITKAAWSGERASPSMCEVARAPCEPVVSLETLAVAVLAFCRTRRP